MFKIREFSAKELIQYFEHVRKLYQACPVECRHIYLLGLQKVWRGLRKTQRQTLRNYGINALDIWLNK